MKINRLDEKRVLVVLGGSDMRDFALDFGVMSMSDAHSRKILLRLTRLACLRSGIDTRGKRLNVEAIMLGDGCYLLVTVKNKPRRYRLKRGGALCYEFDESGALLDAAEAAFRRGFNCVKNSACEWNGKYYLIFDYPALPIALAGILSEFGEKRGGALLCARVRERGKVLCARSALTAIGSLMV